MADRNSLGKIGFVFGGITFAVIMIAAVMVSTHAIENEFRVQASASAAASLSLVR